MFSPATNNDYVKGIQKIAGLSGLNKALCILTRIDEGQTTQQLIDSCDGDAKLVDIWINFMIELKWVERKPSSEKQERRLINPLSSNIFQLTAAGRNALKRYAKYEKTMYA